MWEQVTDPTKTSFQRHLLRRLIQVALLVCTNAVAWASAPLGATEHSITHAESAATEAIKSTVAELIQVLDDQHLKEPEQAEQRRHEVERIVRHRVSYDEMAKRALGTHWSEINEHDRQEFVRLFVQLVWDVFVARINEHAGEQIVYLGEKREDHFAEVNAQVKGQKADTRIDFRLTHASGNWLVYDVVMNGVSIVSNYRAQFTSIIRDVTYVGLVKKVRRHNVRHFRLRLRCDECRPITGFARLSALWYRLPTLLQPSPQTVNDVASTGGTVAYDLAP